MSYTTAAGKKVELDLAQGKFVDENGAETGKFTMYESKEEWLKANNGEAKVEDTDMVFIKDTGEMILGKDLSNTLKRKRQILASRTPKPDLMQERFVRNITMTVR